MGRLAGKDTSLALMVLVAIVQEQDTQGAHVCERQGKRCWGRLRVTSLAK